MSRLFLSWPVTLWAAFAPISVFSCRHLPTPNTPFTHSCSFSFRIAYYCKWSVSIYQETSGRVNESSLVGCIGGEANFRFRKKVGTCECTFHLWGRLSMHFRGCACAHKHKDNSSQRRWMDGDNMRRIYGDSLHVKHFTSTVRRLCSRLVCRRWRRGKIRFRVNATRGCRLPSRSQTKPHYHKELIIIVVCEVFCFVLISLLLSAHWCGTFCTARLKAVVNQAADWILKFECHKGALRV